MGIAVGIDLGTTNSCVAVVQAQRARVVEDLEGKRIQPSVISFPPNGEILAGHAAKDRLVIDPHNTVYSFKRLLGRELGSQEMNHIIEDFPYEVLEGPEGIPAVRTRGREISLPEISAMMLKHLKEMCYENLGVDINEAVITVPANFNDVQRSSTKIAGRIAGFNVLRILNEPTAAALAYGFGGNKAEKIAVYDFGGGTFDITIIELMDDIFEVLSTAGNTFLGGDDFDEKIIGEMRSTFLMQHRYDLGEDPTAMTRVRSVAERIKCQLSTLDEVEATLREIAYGPGGAGIDFSYKMTRKRFEELIEPLVDKSLVTCEEALKLAGLDPSSLDNLILVGGTTRVPMVRRKVEKFFGMEPRTEINPDEVVAIGASIHAYSLTGEELPEKLPERPRPRAGRDMTSGLSASVRTVGLAGRDIESLLPPSDLDFDLDSPDLPGLPDSELTADLPGLPSPGEGAGVADLPGKLSPGAVPIGTMRPSGQGIMGQKGKVRSVQKTMMGIAPPVLEEPIEPDLPFEDPGDSQASPEEIDMDMLELIPESDPPPSPDFPAKYPGDAPDGFGDIGFGALPTEPPGPPEAPVALRSEPPKANAFREPLDMVGGEDDEPVDRSRESFSVDVSVSGKAKSTLLLDVTPRGLGVATAGGYCDQIIERNAAIPIEQSRLFSTSTDGQTEVLVDVYQGESRRVAENAKLGQLQLSGLRSAPRGDIKIRVTFEIDTDGILGVSARNEETGEAQTTRILLTGGMDEDQVNKLVARYSK